MRPFHRNLSEEGGASSAEFALMTVPFIALVLGIIGLTMTLWANQTLQYATEAAARYYSVQTANSGSVPTTAQLRAYANGVYEGPNISPTFTPARGGCGINGYQVTGSGTFPLNAGIFSISVPLTAHACFP
jgi:Flp pilus assembly protein TadG